MPRDLPIGNGNILISFDRDYLLREFYFPHVGQETHTSGERFRFGVFVDGKMNWMPDGWKITREYLDDSLVTHVTLVNEALNLRLICNDLVDFKDNLYVKKLIVENLCDQDREVRLFLAHDFRIYGNAIGDTAEFRPELSSLLHYKGDRYFLINIWANKKFGIDLFATGNKEEGKCEGAWKDAEDGILSQNPIAQGSVDSVLAIPLKIGADKKEESFYWIAAGKNWEEVRALNEMIKKNTPDSIFKRTFDYWKLWVDKERLNYTLLNEKIAKLYKKSLLICRTQMNNCGSIIAANDSDVIYFNRDTYSYMWPRDASLVAYGLSLAGYSCTEFYNFCAQIIEKEGYFLHKYTPSGSLASSWHPWIKDHKPQLPIQEDETALVIWSLWKHYLIFKDIEFIKPLYNTLIKKSADFMMNYRDFKTGLPLQSYDLWEERQGVFTFTVATVFGGLMAAAACAEEFGEKELAQEYTQGAMRMKEALERYLYLKEEKRFARSITFCPDGTTVVDKTLDASLYGLFAFGVYSPDDEKVVNTMNQMYDKLWNTQSGGLARYEDDAFYRDGNKAPSNPWFVTTLWLAQYYIASAKKRADLEKAEKILLWVADHALPSGVLSEQLNPHTNELVSVSPLTWSHGTYIAAVQEYLNKLLELEKCSACGLPKYSKYRSRDVS